MESFFKKEEDSLSSFSLEDIFKDVDLSVVPEDLLRCLTSPPRETSRYSPASSTVREVSVSIGGGSGMGVSAGSSEERSSSFSTEGSPSLAFNLWGSGVTYGRNQVEKSEKADDFPVHYSERKSTNSDGSHSSTLFRSQRPQDQARDAAAASPISSSKTFTSPNTARFFDWVSESEVDTSRMPLHQELLDRKMTNLTVAPTYQQQHQRSVNEPVGISQQPYYRNRRAAETFRQQPSLRIIPNRTVNFNNYAIRFVVKAFHIPPHIPVGPSNFSGYVQMPSGKRIDCSFRNIWNINMYEVDSFTGIFRAEEEIGLHLVHVRLVLPVDMWTPECEYGIIVEELPVLVSRNYYRESSSRKTISFEVEHEPVRLYGTTTTKVWGLACDKPTNRLFVTDREANSFSCVDPEGQVIFKYPVTPSTPMHRRFNRPTGICVDEANRRILVVDKDNHRVLVLTMDGQFIFSFGKNGHKNGEFNYPWDVDVDVTGEKIIVADSRNRRIQLFDKNGMFLAKFSVFEGDPFHYKNNFDYPRGVTFNREGSLIFVADFNSHNVVEVPISMKTFRKVLPEKRLWRPQGITVDDFDHVLVCDSRNNAVRQLHTSTEGQRVVVSQVHSIGNQRLQHPLDIAVMAQGKVAVLDAEAKIRIF